MFNQTDGVKLPRQQDNFKQKAIGYIVLLLLFFYLLYSMFGMFVLVGQSVRAVSKGSPDLLTIMEHADFGKCFMLAFLHPISQGAGLKFAGISILGSAGITFFLTYQMAYAGKQVAYGQKGDSRFTTVKELKDQYPSIPEKSKGFKGYGGFPISHYKDRYFIDTETNHNIVVGTSRSGKGQTIVVPMIDNLSRAEKKSSMVINDPKGELYAGASETLRRRGYDVYLLNMMDLSKSMAYNPLQLVVKSWTQGDTEGAMQLINSLTYTLYHDDNAGQNAWVNEGAQSAVNGMIIALIEYCDNPENFDDGKRHLERVTLNNIIDMMNELGTVQYYKDKNDVSTTNILDEFFKHLPQNSIAKREYGSTNFSEAKAKGSIFSTIVQKLQTFSMPKNARATSANSIELKSIGFPKYVSFAVPKELAGSKMYLRFYKQKPDKHDKDKLLPASRRSKPDADYLISVSFGGFAEYNFADDLRTGDIMGLYYQDPENGKESTAAYKLEINKDKTVNFTKLGDKTKRIKSAQKQIAFLKERLAKQKEHGSETKGTEKLIKEAKNKILAIQQEKELTIGKLKMHYSDKPTAVFLKIPDFDKSNNALASIFVSQLYSELAKQCAFVAGGKTVKRVHFILDEFGNMLPIQDMDQIMTVSAGRNLLFTLIIQSYEQLYSTYGKEKGATIKENGQNQILIATIDKDTLEEFSAKAGNYTVEGGSINKDKMGIASNYNASADSVRLITTERLSQMLVGEDLVLRPLHRLNLKHKKIRPYPIFNTQETELPYAFKILSDEFNLATDPNTLEVAAPHARLDLSSLGIDWRDFTKFDDTGEALKAYNEYHQDDNKDEDKNYRTGVDANHNEDHVGQTEEDMKESEEELENEEEKRQKNINDFLEEYEGYRKELPASDDARRAFEKIKRLAKIAGTRSTKRAECKEQFSEELDKISWAMENDEKIEKLWNEHFS